MEGKGYTSLLDLSPLYLPFSLLLHSHRASSSLPENFDNTHTLENECCSRRLHLVLLYLLLAWLLHKPIAPSDFGRLEWRTSSDRQLEGRPPYGLKLSIRPLVCLWVRSGACLYTVPLMKRGIFITAVISRTRDFMDHGGQWYRFHGNVDVSLCLVCPISEPIPSGRFWALPF